MNVPRGRVMSKIAFIPQSGGQRSSPISLLIWLPMDHCLVGLLEEKLRQDGERKKKSPYYQGIRVISESWHSCSKRCVKCPSRRYNLNVIR